MLRLLRLVLCLTILAHTGGRLFAQDSDLVPHSAAADVSTIIVQPTADPPPGLISLFSNFGPKSDLYDASGGWLVEGPNNSTGVSEAIGNLWYPTANSTIKAIQFALSYDNSGTNNAAVAIFSDNNGLPGKPLKVWNVSNLPPFGFCCALITVLDEAGFQVTANAPYWFVAGTDSGSTTAYDVWNFTYNEIQRGLAFEGTDTGNVWKAYYGAQNAFAIYGTTP